MISCYILDPEFTDCILNAFPAKFSVFKIFLLFYIFIIFAFLFSYCDDMPRYHKNLSVFFNLKSS